MSSEDEEPAEGELTPDQREIRRLATDPEFRHDAINKARHALRKLGWPEPEAAAEDVYQEVVSRLLKSLSRGSVPAEIVNPRAYLLKMVHNEVLRPHAGEKRFLYVPLDDVGIADPSPDPLAEAISAESVSLLREFVRQLSEVDRLVFQLRLKGFTSRAIAIKMEHSYGVTLSHVTVLRRLKSLQKKLLDSITSRKDARRALSAKERRQP